MAPIEILTTLSLHVPGGVELVEPEVVLVVVGAAVAGSRTNKAESICNYRWLLKLTSPILCTEALFLPLKGEEGSIKSVQGATSFYPTTAFPNDTFPTTKDV